MALQRVIDGTVNFHFSGQAKLLHGGWNFKDKKEEERQKNFKDKKKKYRRKSMKVYMRSIPGRKDVRYKRPEAGNRPLELKGRSLREQWQKMK